MATRSPPATITTVTDLHAAFAAPAAAPVARRVRFLEAVDRLPGLVPVRAALRRAGSPPVGGTLLDAGCGLGGETARLAAEHPTVTVIGLDHDPDVLAAARAHSPDLDNLHWRVGDVTALDVLPASVDVVRTERVLMYVAALDDAAASIRSALRPGGVFTGFELDYGATILPSAGSTPDRIRRLTALLEAALPQPWAGRHLPDALAAGGMAVTGVEPFAFAVDRPVWSRIVADTLRAADDPADDPAEGWLAQWLRDVEEHAPFHAVFTGMCVTARRS